jgi:hypothetical protein
MWEILATIFRVFVLVWLEDDRSGARWFSLGCLAIVLAVIGIIALIYSRWN